MTDPVVTASPTAAVGPDSYLSPVPTRSKPYFRTQTPSKQRSQTPSKPRSQTPSKLRSLSPSKLIKKGIQRFASPTRRRATDCIDLSEQQQQQQQQAKAIHNNNIIITKALAPLHRLAKHRLWDEIIGILQFEPEPVIAQWLQRCQDHPRSPIRGGSPLHVVLFYQPPLQVVDLLLKALVQMLGPHAVPEDSIDPQRSQTPLHIAVATGCEYAILDRLTTVTAAQTIDSEGRVPLHWACTHRPFPDRQTIKLLVSVYPAARKLADNFEFTPLMIAQYHRAKPDVCHLLLPSTKLQPPRTNQGGEVVVVDVEEEVSITSFVPNDLPMVVTLGKSFSDISCLHMPPEIEKAPRRRGAKRASSKPKNQKKPPKQPSPSKSPNYIRDHHQQPEEALAVTTMEDDGSSSHRVLEDLPMLVTVGTKQGNTCFGEVSCLELPEMGFDDEPHNDGGGAEHPTTKSPPSPQQNFHKKAAHNSSDNLSKAGESTTSSKRSSTRSSSSCMTPPEKYETVEL